MAKYMDSENFKHFWNNILKPNLLKKVDKVSGKGLSTNDFTDTYKNAIGSLQDSVGALNTTKVDKVIGKDLSTNDFTNEYKDLIVANKDAISKLEGLHRLLRKCLRSSRPNCIHRGTGPSRLRTTARLYCWGWLLTVALSGWDATNRARICWTTRIFQTPSTNAD